MEPLRDDRELLRTYAEEADEQAFAELVNRHTRFVYGAALRQVRDEHLAHDVTQAVFILLARKAKHLHRETRLMGWLYNVARYASANAIRREKRRRKHERQAAIGETSAGCHQDDAAQAAVALLDPALAKLGSIDRETILLRFFGGKSHKQVAQTLGVTEAAAKVRTGRALEKLRTILADREVALSIAGIEAMLAHEAINPEPTELAQQATNTAISASTARPTASVEAILHGATQMMMWTRLRMSGTVAAAAIVVVAGIAITLTHAAAPAPSDKQAATAPAKPSTPKEVVVNAFRSALKGDADAMIAAFDNPTPQQQTTLKRVTGVLSAANALIDAVSAKFGTEAAKPFERLRMGVMTRDIEGSDETITGDTAVVDMGTSGPGNVPLVKVGDQWKISPMALGTLNPRMVEQMGRMTPAVRKLTEDVNAGKYKTVAEFQQAVAGLMMGQTKASTTRPAAASN